MEEEASQVLPNLLIPRETRLLVELHCKIYGLSSANSQLLKKKNHLRIISVAYPRNRTSETPSSRQ